MASRQKTFKTIDEQIDILKEKGLVIDDIDYAKDILTIVRENWEKTASGYGINRRQIEEMRPAFRACYE